MFSPNEFQIGFFMGAAIISCYIIFRSVTFVHQGHVAVVSTFGKIALQDEKNRVVKVLDPGLHLVFPWQRVFQVSVMEKCFDLSGDQGGVTAITADGTILRLDARLRVTPVVASLYPFVCGLRNPVEHIKGLFTCVLRNEIAQFRSPSDALQSVPQAGESVGSYGTIRRRRKELNNRIEEFSRLQIGPQYGVRFESVDIVDIRPPEELETALNAVSNAQAEAETQWARAQAECQQKIISAERGVEIARHQAQAAQKEMGVLARYLAVLRDQGTLSLYIQRRKSEVFGESKAFFLRRSDT